MDPELTNWRLRDNGWLGRILRAGSLVAIMMCLSGSVANAATMTILWDRHADATVTGYKLSWGTASLTYSTTIDVGNQISYVFNSDPTLHYYFSVQAYNAVGLMSAYSAEISWAESAPTVSITAPVGGTVSGSIPVTASASDDVGVLGVQFTLDGAALGAEDTTSPYSVFWSTAGAATGSHTLTAIARDAAGNRTTSAPVTVSVNIGTARRPPAGDYDGDGKSDLTVYRPSIGTWFTRHSSTGYDTASAFQWGLYGDLPVPGDFDGDGKMDFAVYRPANGVWYLRQSTANYTMSVEFQWGLPGDLPVPGDYDGDGKMDLAVYRPSSGMWYIRGGMEVQWGLSGDIAVPGDYDGDGKMDLAVYRPASGMWFIRQSSTNYAPVEFQWGLSGDVAVPGDFDGDGRSDLAVWRPSSGVWFIRQSATGYASSVMFQWGLSGDMPVVGDFDGDGTSDLAVFRPSIGTWFLRPSTTTMSAAFQWGLPGDIPILGRP